MTQFWIGAIILVLVALAFVLPPLLRPSQRQGVAQDALNVTLFKDRLRELDTELAIGTLSQDQYNAARHELQRDLLENQPQAPEQPPRHGGRWLAPVLLIGLPLAAVGIYLQLGQPALIDPPPMAQPAPAASQETLAMESVVQNLQARLLDNPQDIEGWILLGRSMTFLERHNEAVEALAKAHALAPDSADIVAEYADAMARARGGDFSGQPQRLIEQALAMDPELAHALWLAGLAAMQRGQPDRAIDYWNRLLAQLPEDNDVAGMVRSQIERARAATGQTRQPPAPGDAIQVSVTVAEALLARLAPTDRLFVFAVPEAGAGMPLAIIEAPVADLPLTVQLDDSHSGMMGSDQRLSDYRQVIVVARVAKSGTAMPTAGDLEGRAPAQVGAEATVEVVIDRILP